MSTSKRIATALVIVVLLAGVGLANWADSFDGGTFNLTTWKFLSYPQVMPTYTQTVKTTADGNGYLALKETSAANATSLGAAFGVGFGSDEKFTDVRVAATVNVVGDASHNYHGLAARSFYVISDGKNIPGAAPGIVASCYVMHIDWENGPANLTINVEKVVQLQNIMRTDVGAVVPNLNNARSYYAALDEVGSGPVYVQGSLYEFKGGPLVVQTPMMIDTNGNDAWEDPDSGGSNKIFANGPSGIFAQNEHETPPGFYTTFDDVSSSGDAVPAMMPSPANDATGVSMSPSLNWLEAKYATGRQVWFGPVGNMQLVSPNPTGTSVAPGLLQAGTTYQWRVDLVGAKGTTQGDPWTFTTDASIVVEDFESYADSAQIAAAWPHNIPGYDYVFLETSIVHQGAKAMRFTYQNGADPFITVATRTFATAQDWTMGNPAQLSIDFRGVRDNVEQPFYVTLADEAGNTATVTHPLSYAVQSEYWRTWDIALADFAGVNLTAVQKLSIGTGSGTDSGQTSGDVDTLYIDNIRLTFAP